MSDDGERIQRTPLGSPILPPPVDPPPSWSREQRFEPSARDRCVTIARCPPGAPRPALEAVRALIAAQRMSQRCAVLVVAAAGVEGLREICAEVGCSVHLARGAVSEFAGLGLMSRPDGSKALRVFVTTEGLALARSALALAKSRAGVTVRLAREAMR